MPSFAIPTAPGHPTVPPKRKASAAAINESEGYSKRRISQDSRRHRVKARTVSAPNNRSLARLNGPSETRQRPILQPIANVPTTTGKRAERDIATFTNTDSETALGYESDIKESNESAITKAKPSYSETYPKHNIHFQSASLKEIYDDYIAEENKLKESIAALEHDIRVKRDRNIRLERELTANIERLCLEDVE
ncbi:hypothetical protein NW752_002530 [Fusarium irregulare]|uniref:Uncharacterized protein n=1 Tax=Fusarium irregulare TaxID=2494466 RepID=A0A9W8PEB7_9HYPO|nr:hypothetical protein NW766_012773 [Fusarium irregulare]KAJ4025069.1 hypothetical protein NW752_002530 [Fusarium irregulare]